VGEGLRDGGVVGLGGREGVVSCGLTGRRCGGDGGGAVKRAVGLEGRVWGLAEAWAGKGKTWQGTAWRVRKALNAADMAGWECAGLWREDVEEVRSVS